MEYNIPNHYGYCFKREQTVWHIESGRSIHHICGWSIPKSVAIDLNLTQYQDAYLTSNGYWFQSFDRAVLGLSLEHSLELEIKGNCLSIFVPEQWAEANVQPTSRDTYRVFRSGSSWDAEII